MCLTPWVDLGEGVKRSNSNFSEHGHVVYRIKKDHGCSNMAADHPTPPTTLGLGSVGQNSTFQYMVMLHIKLK